MLDFLSDESDGIASSLDSFLDVFDDTYDFPQKQVMTEPPSMAVKDSITPPPSLSLTNPAPVPTLPPATLIAVPSSAPQQYSNHRHHHHAMYVLSAPQGNLGYGVWPMPQTVLNQSACQKFLIAFPMNGNSHCVHRSFPVVPNYTWSSTNFNHPNAFNSMF